MSRKRDADSVPKGIGTSSSGTKKQRREVEKRLARYVAKPSQKTNERIERAYTHRLYLLGRQNLEGQANPNSQEFYVLGATGNAYTVTIAHVPHCTCPDHGFGHICKHMLFVMLRVLRCDRNDPRVWQKALLSTELTSLLTPGSGRADREAEAEELLADVRTREQFQRLKGSKKEVAQQRALEGDCPICYEPLVGNSGAAKEQTIFCTICGNNIHKECFSRWRAAKGTGAVTCVYCRSPWVDDSNPIVEKPINLASFSHHLREGVPSMEELYPGSHQYLSQ